MRGEEPPPSFTATVHLLLNPASTRQLILTGDDFGRSHAVNEAIERHYEAGLLTQASLMVHEECVEEAVLIARRQPGLRVGLHLTLCDGQAAEVSPLTDSRSRFSPSPARAGLRYAFDPRTLGPLTREIGAQFQRFAELGFRPGYFDGHTHLHLHPTVFRLALAEAVRHGFHFVRLVRELRNHAPVALIFRALSARAAHMLEPRGINATDHVFGLRDTGRMTTTRFSRIIERLPDGLSELYFHPGAEPEDLDFSRLRELLASRSVALISSAACRFRR